MDDLKTILRSLDKAISVEDSMRIRTAATSLQECVKRLNEKGIEPNISRRYEQYLTIPTKPEYSEKDMRRAIRIGKKKMCEVILAEGLYEGEEENLKALSLMEIYTIFCPLID